jgi:ATP-dependent protease ClpP protease subunit
MCRWAVTALLLFGAFSSAKAANIFVDKSQVGKPPIVSIIGEIEFSDGEHFSSLAASLQNAVVGLESPGGNMLASLQIGATIRQRGFTTIVPDQMTCASGCALIWLAGARRYVGTTAKIGFHRAFDPVAREQSEVGDEIIARYLASLGLSNEAIAYMTSASPSDMRWLHSDDAKRLGIAADELGNISADVATPNAIRDAGSRFKSEAVKFAIQFFNQWSVFSGSDLFSVLAEEYSDTVGYFGVRKSARDVIAAKQASLRWWPIQDYKLHRETMTARCTESDIECVVTGIVSWYYESRERSVSATGDSRFSLYLRRVSLTRFVIVREEATILNNHPR